MHWITKIHRKVHGITEPETCQCCGRILNDRTMVWLELNCRTGRYVANGVFLPDEESQGFFPFGKACAEKMLRKGVL